MTTLQKVYLCLLLLITVSTMANSTEIFRANANFATTLYKSLSENEGNVFFSPISLHTVLALAYQGAQGDTAAAFAQSLSLPSASDTANGYKSVTAALNSVQNITLDLANKVYIKDGSKLKSSFKNVAKKDFHSEIEQVNFAQNVAAAKTINDWVENKTHNKIKDLIDPSALNDLTRLVLVNAIYFKGDWARQFNPKNTKKEPFYLNENDTVDVDMMHLTKRFFYGENAELDAKVIELPYKNDDFRMVIILPNQRNGIKNLESKLANYDLTTLSRDSFQTEVILSLPKFKIETTMDLEDTLKQLGLGIIFSSEEANFSNFLENPESLFVSKVIQKAFIEVNEEGAEAAAATGMIMMTRSMPMAPQRIEFRADHPFIFFLIQQQDGQQINVLFQGRLMKPA